MRQTHDPAPDLFRYLRWEGDRDHGDEGEI